MADGDDSRSRDQTWGWSIDRHTAQILVSDPTCHGGRGVTMATQQPFVGAATPEKLDSRY